VHEVYAPSGLSIAAKTGLHSYTNADAPEHAAFFFRQGHASFGGNPMRHYVNSGPHVDDCDFFFGNVLYASDPSLNLAFASDWTEKGVKIEVNNPTDQPITATVRSTEHIPGVKTVDETVTVPAGRSVVVVVK